MLKNSEENNSQVRAPKRNYTDVEVSANNYRKPFEEPQIQRPMFVNKNLENKSSNFVELDKDGDVK